MTTSPALPSGLPSRRWRKGAAVLTAAALAVSLVAVGSAAVTASPATASAERQSRAKQGPKAYVGRMGCCQEVLLPGPSGPLKVIVQTPPLPVGKYLVDYSVWTVIGRNEQVACNAWPHTEGGDHGLWGTSGNGSETSGTGPNGVYGSANMTDVIEVTIPGERIDVLCKAGVGDRGTYVAAASVTALKLGSAVIET